MKLLLLLIIIIIYLSFNNNNVDGIPRRIYLNGPDQASRPHYSKHNLQGKTSSIDFSLLNNLIEDDDTTNDTPPSLLESQSHSSSLLSLNSESKSSVVRDMSNRAVQRALELIGYDKPIEDERMLHLVHRQQVYATRQHPMHEPPDILKQERLQQQRQFQQQKQQQPRFLEKEILHHDGNKLSMHPEFYKAFVTDSVENQIPISTSAPIKKKSHSLPTKQNNNELEGELTGFIELDNQKISSHVRHQNVKKKNHDHNVNNILQPDTTNFVQTNSKVDNNIHHSGSSNLGQRHQALLQHHNQLDAQQNLKNMHVRHRNRRRKAPKKKNINAKNEPTLLDTHETTTKEQVQSKQEETQNVNNNNNNNNGGDSGRLPVRAHQQPTHKQLMDALNRKTNEMSNMNAYRPKSPFRRMKRPKYMNTHHYVGTNTRFREVLGRMTSTAHAKAGEAEEGEGEAAFEYRPSPFKHPPPPPVPPPPPPPPPPNFGPGSHFSGYQFGNAALPEQGDQGAKPGDGAEFISMFSKKYPRGHPLAPHTKDRDRLETDKEFQNHIASSQGGAQSFIEMWERVGRESALTTGLDLAQDHLQTQIRMLRPNPHIVVPHPHDYLQEYAAYAHRYYPDLTTYV